jgi:hypothetical protein
MGSSSKDTSLAPLATAITTTRRNCFLTSAAAHARGRAPACWTICISQLDQTSTARRHKRLPSRAAGHEDCLSCSPSGEQACKSEGSMARMQMLGLNIEKYVQDASTLEQLCATWQDAISSQACERLCELWAEAIREPLFASSARRTGSVDGSGNILRPQYGGAPLRPVPVQKCSMLSLCARSTVCAPQASVPELSHPVS